MRWLFDPQAPRPPAPVPQPQRALAVPGLSGLAPDLGSHDPDAVYIGRLVDPHNGITNRIRYGGMQHVLIVGANGKGKDTRLLMPNLLEMSGSSVVVTDVKGELACVTAPFRRSLGRVVMINPFGLFVDKPGYDDLQSVGFNPLSKLDPASQNFNSDAGLLSEAVVIVGGSDPHWDESAQELIAWLIMFVVMEARGLCPPFVIDETRPPPGRVPTFARVRELLCMASAAPSAMNDGEGMGLPKLALQAMEIDNPGLRNKASQFTDWNKETQSITSSAKRQTAAFDDPQIAQDMARDGFDFRELKREPMTVYLILPPEQLARHAKWLRLLLTSALQATMRLRLPGEPKALFMFNEFFALGHLKVIADNYALMRGYGVQLMPVLQDLNQLKKLYGDLWETFVGMAGACCFFGPNDPTTARWLSERAGDKTEQITTHSNSTTWSESKGPDGIPNRSSGGSSNSSSAPAKVPLVTAHTLLGLPPGYMVGTLDGVADIIPMYAPGYYDIVQCKMRDRANPYFRG